MLKSYLNYSHKESQVCEKTNCKTMSLFLLGVVSTVVIGFVVYLFKFKNQIKGYHLTNENVTGTYQDLFAQDTKDTHDKRKNAGWDVAGKYYDMVTDFYLYGWGRSFHFAPRLVFL